MPIIGNLHFLMHFLQAHTNVGPNFRAKVDLVVTPTCYLRLHLDPSGFIRCHLNATCFFHNHALTREVSPAGIEEKYESWGDKQLLVLWRNMSIGMISHHYDKSYNVNKSLLVLFLTCTAITSSVNTLVPNCYELYKSVSASDHNLNWK